jgi:very-short-patch-repair endonuclease
VTRTALQAAIAAQGSDGERAFATQLRQINAPPWVAELEFYPVRKWRFDFAWPELLVAVEIEGGSWSGGRHTSGPGFEADCVKYAEAAILGWLVLRVTTAMVDDGRAVALLGRALWQRSKR